MLRDRVRRVVSSPKTSVEPPVDDRTFLSPEIHHPMLRQAGAWAEHNWDEALRFQDIIEPLVKAEIKKLRGLVQARGRHTDRMQWRIRILEHLIKNRQAIERDILECDGISRGFGLTFEDVG